MRLPLTAHLDRAAATLVRQGTPRGRLAARLARAANAARDRRDFRDAALLYRQALELMPRWHGVRVQAGHMFKEAGDYAEAERHYLLAAEAMPDNADLALQLGHFYKLTERLSHALHHYRRACAILPDWAEASRELVDLERRGGGALDPIADIGAAAIADHEEGLLPELLPGPPPVPPRPLADTIELRRLGARQERSPWGLLPLLSGVEAIRGICFSRAALAEISVLVDDVVLATAPLVAFPDRLGGPTKYVFNLWFDVSHLAAGLHQVELRCADPGDGLARRRRDHVLIAPPLSEVEHPFSDGVVSLNPNDTRQVVTQVRARPSMVRPVADRILRPRPKRILVLRTDQLGDMVVSLPALRRLRVLFPDAEVVGLVTAANADLARVCGLFDEVLVADFPDVLEQRRRVMTREAQLELRKRLHAYRFDLAIDLSLSGLSRPLLLLSGATRLYGFGDGLWPWLAAGVEGGTHDPKNHNEDSPQSSRIVALIDRIGTLFDNDARVERRSDIARADLVDLGLPSTARYAVLHAGARIVFSRWPGYVELAQRLLGETDLYVVAFADNPDVLNRMEAACAGSPRLIVLRERLPFDCLDALLQFASVFVGNDSGPKHLAALRGAPVVSLHSARINWREWAQEQTGVVISRRVPCAGCTLYHDVEECGQDYACITDIRVGEVFDAVAALL